MIEDWTLPSLIFNMSVEAELSGLHSAKSIRHLEQIAGLRTRGTGDYGDLL